VGRVSTRPGRTACAPNRGLSKAEPRAPRFGVRWLSHRFRITFVFQSGGSRRRTPNAARDHAVGPRASPWQTAAAHL